MIDLKIKAMIGKEIGEFIDWLLGLKKNEQFTNEDYHAIGLYSLYLAHKLTKDVKKS